MHIRLTCFLALTFVTVDAAADPSPSREGLASSNELRFGIGAWSARWSDAEALPDTFSDRTVYWMPSVEARLYNTDGHGLTVGLDYRVDTDPELCFFGPCSSVRVDFFVAHVGYAYRVIAHPKRHPERRAWTFTPHASASSGAAFFEPENVDASGLLKRSPVVGGSAGLDIDFHLHRFFMGWSFTYELLFHTRGAISRSNFLYFNAVPLWRIGITFGHRVQDLKSPGQKRSGEPRKSTWPGY